MPGILFLLAKTGERKTGTNIDRMKDGRAPIGPDGESVNLHHNTGSEVNPDGSRGTLVELSRTEHRGTANNGILHYPRPPLDPNAPTPNQTLPTYPSWRKNNDGTRSVQDKEFEAFKEQYWKDRANDFSQPNTSSSP